MSRLDELIQELCPDGVEYKTLGELGKFYGGITGKSKDDFTDGNAKFITYKNVYSNPALDIDVDDKVKISDNENQRTLEYGDVIFTGSSETPDECGISSVLTQRTNEKLYLNSFCFVFRFNDNSIMLPNFSKHLFRSGELRYQIGKTANGVTRFNVSKKLMEKVKIPVPPLEVQNEIVRILDNFTELTAELTEELTAELTARKKQYEFYRDTLLTFNDNNPLRSLISHYCPSGVEYKKIGDIAFISTGSKLRDIQESHSLYEYINAGTTNSGYSLDWNCDGDVVTTPSRGQGGIGYVGYQKNKFWLGPLCYKIVGNADFVLNKYLYYYLSNNSYEILSLKKDGGVPAINKSDLEELILPVPPLEVQRQIVQILDRFDTICSDLNIGLPAEIEARQKQYEYYRDRLLDFEPITK